jgi:hypothetical protein
LTEKFCAKEIKRRAAMEKDADTTFMELRASLEKPGIDAMITEFVEEFDPHKRSNRLPTPNLTLAKLTRQISNLKCAMPYFGAVYKSGSYKGVRLIDRADRDGRERSRLVESHGSHEACYGLEWNKEIALRHLPEDQRRVVDYLKWESCEFKVYRQCVMDEPSNQGAQRYGQPGAQRYG